jgi:hypothetical protein
MVLHPTGLVPLRRIMVRPVDHATAIVPDVLTAEHHRITRLDGDPRGEIDVVRHENRETVRDADQKPLMARALRVIGQKPSHTAASLDLDVGRMRPRSGDQ